MYLSYMDYLGLGGGLDEPVFTRLEWKACKYIDKYTFGRLKHDFKISASVKMTVFEIIGLLEQKDNTAYSNGNDSQGNISSYSNDGLSVTFDKENVSQFLEKFDSRIGSVIKDNLTGERNQNGAVLLYRGYQQADFLPYPEKDGNGGNNNDTVKPVIPPEPPETGEPEKPEEGAGTDET